MSQTIYDCVVATFSKLGMSAPIEVYETLLIKDGLFIGRKFHCDGGYAIWQAGWPAVEFYCEDGKLLTLVAVKTALRSSA
jgi:hypothetical protein